MSLTRPILLIEDNPMDVELTVRAFTRSHLTNPVEIARDGEEALAWIDRWRAGVPPPVVILLDLKLPKVDGLQVLRRLKDHELLRTIPVVILTTSTRSGDIAEAYAIGANSFIVKPVDFGRFLEVVAQLQLYWTVLNRPPEDGEIA